jgi:hypothetical protein
MMAVRNCDFVKTKKDTESRKVAEKSKMKQCVAPGNAIGVGKNLLV